MKCIYVRKVPRHIYFPEMRVVPRIRYPIITVTLSCVASHTFVVLCQVNIMIHSH